jgi:hypothetical protein
VIAEKLLALPEFLLLAHRLVQKTQLSALSYALFRDETESAKQSRQRQQVQLLKWM